MALAVIRVSCPVTELPERELDGEPCVPRAAAIAKELDCRSEMDDSVNNPTAITVSRIIRLRVTISANPRFSKDLRVIGGWFFIGLGEACSYNGHSKPGFNRKVWRRREMAIKPRDFWTAN